MVFPWLPHGFSTWMYTPTDGKCLLAMVTGVTYSPFRVYYHGFIIPLVTLGAAHVTVQDSSSRHGIVIQDMMQSISDCHKPSWVVNKHYQGFLTIPDHNDLRINRQKAESTIAKKHFSPSWNSVHQHSLSLPVIIRYKTCAISPLSSNQHRTVKFPWTKHSRILTWPWTTQNKHDLLNIKNHH